MLLLKEEKTKLHYYFINPISVNLADFPRIAAIFASKKATWNGQYFSWTWDWCSRKTKLRLRSAKHIVRSYRGVCSDATIFSEDTDISVSRCVLCSPCPRASRARKSNKVKRRLAVGQAPDLQPLASARRIPCVLAARIVTSHCTRRIVCSARCTEPSPAHPRPPTYLSTPNVATLSSARGRKSGCTDDNYWRFGPSCVCLVETAGRLLPQQSAGLFSPRGASRAWTDAGDWPSCLQ